MADQSLSQQVSLRELFSFVFQILGPESTYYSLALVYGVGIGVLSLATPISVQMLINTVANTGLVAPIIVLSTVLFVLLMISGLLNALRLHLMDLFARRFYARMVSEIAMRSVFALNPFFHDSNMGTLFNRYFDIIIVQKTLPYLLIGGFTILLQAAVGFVLVSMYHPLFLAFNLVIILCMWLIWSIWGKRAIRSAVQVSHKKHAAAAWLEGLGTSNGYFKSENHIHEALRRTDAVTEDYINQHKTHFAHHFSQQLSFLLLYAAASAILLGLGGWLVVQGELSLGQLVAAELVLSVVFVGLSQFGVYLTYFYDVCAAIDELSQFYRVEQEEPGVDYDFGDTDSSIEFAEARGDARGSTASLSFRIPSNARVLGVRETHGVQREVTNFLKRHVSPKGGYVALGGVDIRSIPAHELRQQIIILDRPNAIEMTIREYLAMSSESQPETAVLETLRAVGLEPAISQLEDGLETRIAATGWPLTITETMQLKLAAAVLANPRVLILNQIYDVMTDASLRNAFDMVQRDGNTTVIYFSSRPRDLGFDNYLYLGRDKQVVCATFEELYRRTDREPSNPAFDGFDGDPALQEG